MILNYTMPIYVTDIYLQKYMNAVADTYFITDILIKDNKYLTIKTSQVLTSNEQVNLQTYIDNYTNTDSELLDCSTLTKTTEWGLGMIKQFSIKNMNRKRLGEMGRIELKDIMKELHDSQIYMCMLAGSLDTLHGLLNGFPEETINGVTYSAEAPYNFEKVCEEDLIWFKDELNSFLGTL